MTLECWRAMVQFFRDRPERIHITLCAVDLTVIVVLSVRVKYFLSSLGWALYLSLPINRLCELVYYLLVSGETSWLYSVLQTLSIFIGVFLVSRDRIVIFILLLLWEWYILVNLLSTHPRRTCVSANCLRRYRYEPQATSDRDRGRAVSTAATTARPMQPPLVAECESVLIVDPNGSTAFGLRIVRNYGDGGEGNNDWIGECEHSSLLLLQEERDEEDSGNKENLGGEAAI
jgi:hypothetical protein